MKRNLKLSPKPSIKLNVSTLVKVSAGISLIVVLSVIGYFIFQNLIATKTARADSQASVTLNAVPKIVISEIGAKGYQNLQKNEYIELYNPGDVDINLSSFSLDYYKGSKLSGSFNLSGILMPDSFLVIATNNTVGQAPTLAYDLLVSQASWVLNGSNFMVLKENSVVIDNAGSVDFKPSNNYERLDYLGDGSSSIDWLNTSSNYETPGTINNIDIKTTNITTSSSYINLATSSAIQTGVRIKGKSPAPGVISSKITRGKDVLNPQFSTIKKFATISSSNPSGKGDLMFYYLDSELNGIPENELALFSYKNGEWTNLGGTVNYSSNYLTASNVTDLNGVYTLASKLSESVTLPIKLVYFDLEKINETVLVKWQTASEKNNEYFTIERSLDAENFEVIGSQKGAGNSVVSIDYSFIDKNPPTGTFYYRLKQTDFDGNYEYFPIKSMNMEASSNELIVKSIYPNPFESNFVVNFNTNLSSRVEMRIYSVNGRLVDSKEINAFEGLNDIEWTDSYNLPSGYYFVSLVQDKVTSKAIKIIKK